MKRKNLELADDDFENSNQSKVSKKLKMFDLNKQYIHATCTYNYMLNDPLSDWLNYNNSNTNHSNSSNSNSSNFNSNSSNFNSNDLKNDNFRSFIMEKGCQFEAELITYIKSKNLPIISVSNRITDESVNTTIKLMKKGTPIIHSAPVRNKTNYTHGIIDLLVRSDYLHKLIEDSPLSKEEQKISATKLKKKYHYVVIDIKFSTIPLCANGKNILNSSSFPAYKSQCLIYNDAVSQIQGYKSQYAFILGRRWNYTSKGIDYKSDNCLNKLGVIDYDGFDSDYIVKTKKALKWVRENRKNGHKWKINPPSRKELYPNMCFDAGNLQVEKQEIAQELGEITNVWYCGVKNRNLCLEKGIKSWRNKKCNSKTLGIKGVRGSVIDKILDINRQNKDVIRPKKIISNLYNWKNDKNYLENNLKVDKNLKVVKNLKVDKNCNEIYVDFETLNDVFTSFENLPYQETTDMIFMIGIYYKNKNSWKYKSFICDKISVDEEYRIMDEFCQFLKEQNNPKIWYWFAEKNFWNRYQNKQYTNQNMERKNNIVENWNITNWADMYEVFKYEPIVIKDCFKFGLKDIAKAMKKHGLIKTELESDCVSGLSAMISAYRCYQTEPNPEKCKIMKDIEKYNKFDVSVLKEILTYLRKNHI